MHTLSTLPSLIASVLAAAPTPPAAPAPTSSGEPLLGPLQWVLLLALIGLIVFFFIYRKKQRDNQ